MTDQRDAMEPPLAELLEDPITQIVMRHDGVSMAELLDLIDETRRRLGDPRPPVARFAAVCSAEP